MSPYQLSPSSVPGTEFPTHLSDMGDGCFNPTLHSTLNFSSTETSSVVVLVTQSCSTLCTSMDFSLPGSSVHVILQARRLGSVAIPFYKGSSQPRNRQTWVSSTARRLFTAWATREVAQAVNFQNFHISLGNMKNHTKRQGIIRPSCGYPPTRAYGCASLFLRQKKMWIKLMSP